MSKIRVFFIIYNQIKFQIFYVCITDLFREILNYLFLCLGNNFANFYKSERRREQIDQKRAALEAKKLAGHITPFGQDNLASIRLSVTELDGQSRGKMTLIYLELNE